MSSTAKGRKNKTANRFTGRGKVSSQNSVANFEGVYGNPRLVHALFSLVGSKCNTQVKNGGIYNGILHTFSPNMDLVIGAAHKTQECASGSDPDSILDVNPSSVPNQDDIIDHLIFKSKDVVCATFHDVDLNFAEVSNGLKSNGDAGIESRFPSSNGTEPRILEPWDGGGDTSTDLSIGGLEDGLASATGNGTNGWGPEEMFRTNLDKYGVQTSYNPDLPEYTTPLDNENTDEFAQRKARADKLANEIEKTASYNKHINLELDDGMTEEDKFSAVVRETPPARDQPKADRFSRNRARPRDQGRDPRGPRPTHFNYGGPGAAQRGSGPPTSGSYGPGGGRSNTPTNPSESPTSPSSQSKALPQQVGTGRPIAPRFNKGYQRDEERGGRTHENRLHENTSHHNSYVNQSKQQRQTGQQRSSYSRNHPSPTQDYTQQPTDSPAVMSGQTTPQSLSRNSSTSSVNQQVTSPQHWGNKGPPASNDDRGHSSGTSASSSGVNPPLTRNFSSGSNRGGGRFKVQGVSIIPKILGRSSKGISRSAEDISKVRSDSSYSSIVQSSTSGKLMQGVQPPAGQFSERGYRQGTGIRQAMPTTGGPHPPSQGARFYLSPRGHSPPTFSAMMVSPVIGSQGGQNMGQMHQPQRQMMGMPQQSQPQQRYPTPVPASSNPAAPQANRGQRPTAPADGDAKTAAKKTPETSTASTSSPSTVNVAPSKSKDGTDGFQTNVKQLKEFSKNFKLLEPPANEQCKTSTAPTQAKISSEPGVSSKPTLAGKARSAPASQSVQQPTLAATNAGHQQPPGQPAQHQPVKQMTPQQPTQPPPQSIPQRTPSMDGVDPHNQPGIILLHPAPGIMQPGVMPPGQYHIAETHIPQTTAPPPQPSINIPSPRTTTTASDVVTVSAATGPFISPQHSVVAQTESQAAPPQKAPESNTSAEVETTPPSTKDVTSDPYTSPDMIHLTKQLNPDAKEFTPRSFAPKSAGTPRSPTPVTPLQPGPATFYTSSGQPITPTAPAQMQYIIGPKTQMPKQVSGQTLLSPSPTDAPVVGMSPHMTHPIHPTTAGHFIGGHPYHAHPGAPMVFAPPPGAHQQMAAAGQHGVMTPTQVQPYPNVEQMVYTPGHIMQPATPRAYTTEQQLYAGYQPAQPVQIQQQPPQQPQQPAQPQQQVAQTNYMQQQPRPHSAHTPNPGHIPPTSPANIQPQSGAGMAVNPPPQMHPPPQNQVMASQNYYQQPIIAHPSSMHGQMVQNSPHAPYPSLPSRYMVVPGAPPGHNPNASQQGYMQPAVVSTTAHIQPQYPRHQYAHHQGQPVVPAYQQQQPN